VAIGVAVRMTYSIAIAASYTSAVRLAPPTWTSIATPKLLALISAGVKAVPHTSAVPSQLEAPTAVDHAIPALFVPV
jgi:hypothetical protein